MALTVEDLEDQSRFRQLLEIRYNELIPFIVDYLRRKSALTMFFWAVCFAFFLIALGVRLKLVYIFPHGRIMLHSLLGLVVFPLLSIPLHEGLHIIPFFLSGARNIRIGMDLKQYLFYVTAHRYVASPLQFRIIALIPFILISSAFLVFLYLAPGLWKWSISLFLFSHATMCAGDFALLNYYVLNRNKKIYTWDDADRKVAYFYEEIL